MAIELISTITTKNNGSYAIALSNEIQGGLHSKKTLKERDNISTERLQEGMLCYVEEARQYYQWKEEVWQVFSVGGGDSSGTPMYRVDTYEDMISILAVDIKNGTLCHVKNDINENYLYYFHNDTWCTIGSKYQVWIGTSEPPNKNHLWVDTRNMVNGDDVTIDNPPTFIDTPLIQYLKNQIVALSQKIFNLQSQLEDAIENGISGGGNGGNGGNNGGSGTVKPVEENRFVTEEGDYIITEDGNYFLTEDSDVNLGDDSVIGNINGIELLTEDGQNLMTEDGNYFVAENGTSDGGVDSGNNSGSSGGNNNSGNNSGSSGGNNNTDDEEEIEEDIAYPIKGGRITTTVVDEEILIDGSVLSQVTIFNESEKEIHITINFGEEIPLEVEESLSLGDIKIYSIIIAESKSTIKYIGY
jgi:hypothetical protein